MSSSSSSSSSSSCLQYLFLIIVSLLLFILPAAAAAISSSADSINKNKFLECSPRTYQCGVDEGINYTISYPFWMADMPEYCGHPKLQLECISRNSLLLLAININGNDYHVQAIDYNNQRINVSRLDLYSNNSSCPTMPMLTNTNTNSWIDLSLFNYTTFDRYVTVFVNCSDLSAFSPDLTPIDCLTNKSTGRYSYYSLSPPPPPPPPGVEYSDQSCSLLIEIPIYMVVLKYLETRAMDFVQAVRQGFELSWMAGQQWCDGCKHTGGVCGFDSSSPDSPTCFCPDGRTTPGTCLKEKKNVKKTIAIACAVGGVVALIAACCVFFWYKRRKRLQQSVLSNLPTQSTSSKFSSTNDPEFSESNYQTHIFSYEELQEATNGFDASRELGDGGFGTVYKGKLRDGRTVAVKRLYENYKRLEQFMNEVDILSRLRHPNLVTLYGCTSRRSRELLLVYEFVASGTVAEHLHGTHASSGPLLWQDRMSIAIETADALSYLHAIEPPIIHRDVKSNNILLDSSLHVKVADFGLSRLFPLDATHVSTAPQGTPGYVDPEYHQCYQLTDKSDVYSFGVVLVELISSKPAVDISRSRHEINLANMAVNKIQKSQLDELVDPALGYHSDLGVKRMVCQVAELAFRCLQSDGDLRPSIKEVLEELKRIHSQVRNTEEEKEEVDASLFSPDSVAERWHSRSTTPNSSE